MKFVDTFDKAVEFVRPGGGPRVTGRAHVPLLALMPHRPSAAATTTTPDSTLTDRRVVRR
ncbi:hypothetical protein [Mycolicibacterium hodleri]|uniref:Uncharacterized protein n=1 Tax=Mycolicibacterium hodleri TaxID=49897 RepID=A0A502EF10_9MYCO|nr:hypothetical protein [Mycolicibacterium hodleri]TPG34941.1 hypothetical protein EAH80_08995 [Mycolicibacterium hodleri]